MLGPLAQLVILVVFALIGVAAGVFQMHDARVCPCCGSQLARGPARCPHCLCRLD